MPSNSSSISSLQLQATSGTVPVGLNVHAKEWRVGSIPDDYPTSETSTPPLGGNGSRPPRGGGNSKIICQFFAMGDCKYGQDCPYSHTLTQEAPEGVDASGGFFISGRVANLPAASSSTPASAAPLGGGSSNSSTSMNNAISSTATAPPPPQGQQQTLQSITSFGQQQQEALHQQQQLALMQQQLQFLEMNHHASNIDTSAPAPSFPQLSPYQQAASRGQAQGNGQPFRYTTTADGDVTMVPIEFLQQQHQAAAAAGGNQLMMFSHHSGNQDRVVYPAPLQPQQLQQFPAGGGMGQQQMGFGPSQQGMQQNMSQPPTRELMNTSPVYIGASTASAVSPVMQQPQVNQTFSGSGGNVSYGDPSMYMHQQLQSMQQQQQLKPPSMMLGANDPRQAAFVQSLAAPSGSGALQGGGSMQKMDPAIYQIGKSIQMAAAPSPGPAAGMTPHHAASSMTAFSNHSMTPQAFLPAADQPATSTGGPFGTTDLVNQHFSPTASQTHSPIPNGAPTFPQGRPPLMSNSTNFSMQHQATPTSQGIFVSPTGAGHTNAQGYFSQPSQLLSQGGSNQGMFQSTSPFPAQQQSVGPASMGGSQSSQVVHVGQKLQQQQVSGSFTPTGPQDPFMAPSQQQQPQQQSQGVSPAALSNSIHWSAPCPTNQQQQQLLMTLQQQQLLSASQQQPSAMSYASAARGQTPTLSQQQQQAAAYYAAWQQQQTQNGNFALTNNAGGMTISPQQAPPPPQQQSTNFNGASHGGQAPISIGGQLPSGNVTPLSMKPSAPPSAGSSLVLSAPPRPVATSAPQGRLSTSNAYFSAELLGAFGGTASNAALVAVGGFTASRRESGASVCSNDGTAPAMYTLPSPQSQQPPANGGGMPHAAGSGPRPVVPQSIDAIDPPEPSGSVISAPSPLQISDPQLQSMSSMPSANGVFKTASSSITSRMQAPTPLQ